MARHITRCPDAIGEVVDGELVLLNVRTGVYFGLNPTGTKIWELLERHSDVDELHLALTGLYPVSPAVLRADLDALVLDLEKAGLVRELATP